MWPTLMYVPIIILIAGWLVLVAYLAWRYRNDTKRQKENGINLMAPDLSVSDDLFVQKEYRTMPVDDDGDKDLDVDEAVASRSFGGANVELDDVDVTVPTLFSKVDQSEELEPTSQPSLDESALSETLEDLNSTTNLQSQLAAIRKEKGLAGLHKKNKERVGTSAAANAVSEDAEEEMSIPEVPSDDDGNPDLVAHIRNLESRVLEQDRDVHMLYSELKSARAFEVKYYECDTRLADIQTILLKKEDYIADMLAHGKRLDADNSALSRRNLELRNALSALQNYQAGITGEDSPDIQFDEKEEALGESKKEDENESSQTHLQGDQSALLKKFEAQTKQLTEQLHEKEKDISWLNSQLISASKLQDKLSGKQLEMLELQSKVQQVESKLRDLTPQSGESESLSPQAMSNKQEELSDTAHLEKNSSYQELRSAFTALQLESAGQYDQESSQEKKLTASASHTSYSDDAEGEEVADQEATGEEVIDEETIDEEAIGEEAIGEEAIGEAAQANNLIEVKRYRAPVSSRKGGSSATLSNISTDTNGEFRMRTMRVKARHRKVDNRFGASSSFENPPSIPSINKNALSKINLEKDDLKRVKGIGPAIEKTLNEIGIVSFKQISELTSDDIRSLSDAIKVFPGRIERDDWVGSAKKLFEEKQSSSARA